MAEPWEAQRFLVADDPELAETAKGPAPGTSDVSQRGLRRKVVAAAVAMLTVAIFACAGSVHLGEASSGEVSDRARFGKASCGEVADPTRFDKANVGEAIQQSSDGKLKYLVMGSDDFKDCEGWPEWKNGFKLFPQGTTQDGRPWYKNEWNGRLWFDMNPNGKDDDCGWVLRRDGGDWGNWDPNRKHDIDGDHKIAWDARAPPMDSLRARDAPPSTSDAWSIKCGGAWASDNVKIVKVYD